MMICAVQAAALFLAGLIDQIPISGYAPEAMRPRPRHAAGRRPARGDFTKRTQGVS